MMLLDNRGFVYLLFTLWSVIRPGDGGLIGATTIKGDTRKYKVVCYHTNWSQYRQKPARFYPYNIDPNICTHIIYSFAKIDYRGQLAPLEWNDIDYPHMYRQFNNLKKKNPKLKTLLAVGGWNHGSKSFTDMVKSKESRRYFIDQTIQYLRAHKFDGLDLDWEYPANRGSPPEDKMRFVSLVQELRKAFELEGSKTNRERLLLSAAVGCGYKIIDSAYDVRGMSSSFDFINLMTYDLHGSWEKELGVNAPLYPRKDDIGKPAGKLNVDWVVKRFIELGAPADKLIMGIPLYGRSFKLCGNDVTPGAKACGAGNPGPFTKEKGFMAYYEIVRGFQDGWVREWDSQQMTPYAYSTREKQWVGYDDMESIYHKAMYVKSHTLGGVMVWALDLDDFANIATEGMNYPLIRTISDVLWDDFLLPPSAVPEQISTLGTIKSTVNWTQVEIRTISPRPIRLKTVTTSSKWTTRKSTTTSAPTARRVTSRRNPYTPPKPKPTKRTTRVTLPPKRILTLPKRNKTTTTKHIPRYTIRTTTKRSSMRTTTNDTVTMLVTTTPATIRRLTLNVKPRRTTQPKVKSINTWRTTTPDHKPVTSPSIATTTTKRTTTSTRRTTTQSRSRSTRFSKRTTSPPRTISNVTPSTTHKIHSTKSKTTTRHPDRTTWKWWYRTTSRKTKSPRKSTTKNPYHKSTTRRPLTTRKWRRKTTTVPPRRHLATVRYINSTGDYKIQNVKKPGKSESSTPCIIVQVQEKVDHIKNLFPERRPVYTTRNPFSVQQTMTDFTCPTIFGIYADPEDCVRFYQCVWFVPFHYSCGPGTAWNDPLKVCDWPDRVHCSR